MLSQNTHYVENFEREGAAAAAPCGLPPFHNPPPPGGGVARVPNPVTPSRVTNSTGAPGRGPLAAKNG